MSLFILVTTNLFSLRRDQQLIYLRNKRILK